VSGKGRIIDISQPLGPGTAVWPGDAPLVLGWSLRRDRGDSVDAAQLRLGVHTGTHVDGPSHTGGGPGAGGLPLEPFVGPALVLDARPFVGGDPAEVGEAVLEGADPGVTPRVLLRTRDTVDPGRFPERFAALSVELAGRLVRDGFRLVATDAPSVDPVDSTLLRAHRILAEGGVVNVENVVLTEVEPGRYTFIGLPLRLEGADSSPIRAVLIPELEEARNSPGPMG
jgi:arylformamidase